MTADIGAARTNKLEMGLKRMIYGYYAVILIILLAGVKFAGLHSYNEEFLSLQESKAVQAICAILIMLHHMAQPLTECKEIQFLLDAGILFVAVFFFCSGYGLIKSMQQKEGYLKHFLKKRLVVILVPFYIINVFYMLFMYAEGAYSGMNGGTLVKELLLNFTGIKLANGNAWYIIVIAFLYVLFYVFFRFCNEITAFILMGLVLAAYSGVGLYLDHGECQWWLQGEWWYNTVFLFYAGMLFARFEQSILKGFKKVYYILLPVSIAAFAFLFRFSVKILYQYSYWCEYDPTLTRQGIMMNRSMCLGTQIIAMLVFVLAVLLVALKLHFRNPVLNFLGKISLEIYLIHGIFIELFHSQFIYIQKDEFYVGAVLLASIASAFLIWLLVSKINLLLLGKKKA